MLNKKKIYENCKIVNTAIGEDNPDLPFEFIRDILEAKAEKEAGLGKSFNLD